MKIDPQKKHRIEVTVKLLLEGLNMFKGTNLASPLSLMWIKPDSTEQ